MQKAVQIDLETNYSNSCQFIPTVVLTGLPSGPAQIEQDAVLSESYGR